jgi:hypothetical protein
MVTPAEAVASVSVTVVRLTPSKSVHPVPEQIAGLDVRRLDLPVPPRLPRGMDPQARNASVQRERQEAVAAALATDSAAVKVVWVADEVLFGVVQGQILDRDDCLAVTTLLAAEGAVKALLRGESLASIVWPPISVPRQALEQAGLASVAGERCDVRELEDAGPDAPWLEFTDTGIAVRTGRLGPLERAAALERVGPRRPEGGHLLIAPANYAGQGRAWAQAVEDHVPGFTAADFTVRTVGSPREFPADHLALSHEFMEPLTRLDLALEFGAPATHVLIEDLSPLFRTSSLRGPFPLSGDGERDLDRLMASGRRVAVLAHGSAARDPATHASLYAWSPWHSPTSELTVAETESTDAFRRAWDAVRERELPLFTATLDMLDYLPEAVWLPIVAGSAFFGPTTPWAPGGKLRVAHIPSSDVKKGSDVVDDALTELDRQGVIEYRSVRDVASVRMPHVLRDVDVVVDQVVLGNPATLLIETMASGRLGVAHVAPHVRRRFPEPLPVVEADGNLVGEVIAEIAADPERYRPLAEAGPAFARRFHDGRLSAEVLARHFLTPEVTP